MAVCGIVDVYQGVDKVCDWISYKQIGDLTPSRHHCMALGEGSGLLWQTDGRDSLAGDHPVQSHDGDIIDWSKSDALRSTISFIPRLECLTSLKLFYQFTSREF